MILASHGIIGSQITQFVGLLDDYSGAAAAYSLRLLRRAYTGSAIRVRIATTGNPEYNIGFVDNELDVATLEGYCTGGLDAFVKTWYDQSGNGYDAAQSTAANQPQIVSSGSVILENGKPIVDFNNKIQSLQKLNITSFTGFSHIGVLIATALESNGFCHFIGLKDRDGSAMGVRATLKLYDFNGGFGNTNALDNSVSLSERVLLYSQNISNSAELFKNGTSISTATGTTISLDDIIIGNSGNINFGDVNGVGTKKIQEYILYPSDQSSNRTGIEDNINDFYSIY